MERNPRVLRTNGAVPGCRCRQHCLECMLKGPSDGTQIAAHGVLHIGLAMVDEPAFGGAPKGGTHAVQGGGDGRGRGGYFFA